VFHATGAGFTNWHAFATAIFAAADRPPPVLHAITTADYPTKAARPADGRMDGSKLRETFGVQLPPWQAGLDRVMKVLAQAS